MGYIEMHYKAPTAADIERLKRDLGHDGTQMAKLFGVADPRAFRRYTSKSPLEKNKREISAHIVSVIDAVAKQYDVPLVQQYNQILDTPNWCSLLSDGFAHPTPALYAIKAQNEAAVLAPLIRKLM